MIKHAKSTKNNRRAASRSSHARLKKTIKRTKPKILKHKPKAIMRKASSTTKRVVKKVFRKQVIGTKPKKQLNVKEIKQKITNEQKRIEAPHAEKQEKRKKEIAVSVPTAEDARKAIEEIYNNNAAMEYLRKNVSKRTMDVITMLETPKTDEFIAEQLEMKVNAARRILNITQGYGITDYYVSKNTGGWLSFAWYIKTNKIKPFFDYITNANSNSSVINSACDDYFICDNCYKSDKLIFVFASAYEIGFKCSCGKNLTRINRQEAEQLVNTSSQEQDSSAKPLSVPERAITKKQ